jgi:hypothetical protein
MAMLAGPPPVVVAANMARNQVALQPAQVEQLHRQLAQHVQLLVTNFLMAAHMPGHEAAIGAAGCLIHALQVCPTTRSAMQASSMSDARCWE